MELESVEEMDFEEHFGRGDDDDDMMGGERVNGAVDMAQSMSPSVGSLEDDEDDHEVGREEVQRGRKPRAVQEVVKVKEEIGMETS